MSDNRKPQIENRQSGALDYWPEPELDRIGAELVGKYHNHLLEAEISYLVTSKTMSRAGKAIAGKARKASGLIKYYARSDFIIVVADTFWQAVGRPERLALVDHELSHCSVDHDEDGNRSWVLVGHDIEEFTAVVDRHGLWHDALKKFGRSAAKQLELDLAKPNQKSEAKAEVVH